MLTATAFHAAGSGEKDEKAVLGDSGTPEEVEKGLLLLIASDTPGLQVYACLNPFLLMLSIMQSYFSNFYLVFISILCWIQTNYLSCKPRRVLICVQCWR